MRRGHETGEKTDDNGIVGQWGDRALTSSTEMGRTTRLKHGEKKKIFIIRFFPIITERGNEIVVSALLTRIGYIVKCWLSSSVNVIKRVSDCSIPVTRPANSLFD